ncbi:MAG: MaoC family dehydratase N-terminal domain-containing protein [Deltaproteobacteria bacterium]|nr:MaoC family dehydratase N-terminal domain-containing protein [Deltaproteobacteria bacterium]
MIDQFPIGSTLSQTLPPIGADRAENFRQATRSDHSPGFIPALPTLFRQAEFQWLDKLKVDWHKLLHAEQAYEYYAPLPLDQPILIESRLANVRVRKSAASSMTFVEIETHISAAGTVAVAALTNFVVREGTT